MSFFFSLVISEWYFILWLSVSSFSSLASSAGISHSNFSDNCSPHKFLPLLKKKHDNYFLCLWFNCFYDHNFLTFVFTTISFPKLLLRHKKHWKKMDEWQNHCIFMKLYFAKANDDKKKPLFLKCGIFSGWKCQKSTTSWGDNWGSKFFTTTKKWG